MKSVRFHLDASAPFRLDLTAWALRRRPRNLIDRWDGRQYSRVLVVDDAPLHLSVAQKARSARPQIECICSYLDRAPNPDEVKAALDRLLGLHVDLSGFRRIACHDSRLRALVERYSGFHPPRFPTVFETAVNAICCQQLSLEAGLELLNRLSSRTGIRFKSDRELLFGPPEPRKVATLLRRDLRNLGFSRQKTDALLELASVFAKEGDRFEDLSGTDDQSALRSLMQLKGIGRWSAEYILLRGLRRLNVFPGDDIAAAKNLRQWLGIRRERQFGYEEIRAALQRWAPFQGLVYFHLLLANLAARDWLNSAKPAEVA
jgi:DNA-3-methyladenine glycosylase II